MASSAEAPSPARLLTAWRLVPQQRSDAAFDGEGARLYGGRWNSPGHAAVYLADSRALAALETLVHSSPESQKTAYVLFEVSFAADLVTEIDIRPLREALRSPTILPETRRAGDAWLAGGRSPLLRVASAIIPEEINYLLNPAHPEFPLIEIGAARQFAFDPRLLQGA
ncbi:MAG: RES family NAD+ phosphorylase [Oceanipulchritudo sp.]